MQKQFIAFKEIGCQGNIISIHIPLVDMTQNISAGFYFASVLEDEEKSIETDIYLEGKKFPYTCRQ